MKEVGRGEALLYNHAITNNLGEKMPPVVFILIDGLRPDAISAAHCPNLAALQARSAVTLCASSVMPSITLPCHATIFHSVPPSRHGITDNVWTPMARPVPGLFDQARANNLRCGFFYNWEPLRDLGRPGSLYLSFFRDTSYDPDGDDAIADAAYKVGSTGLDFAFFYLGCLDSYGHAFGWMSDGYLAQLGRTDAALGRLLAALPSDSTVLLQSDHGGHERTHGTALAEDMTIPWMVSGPRIRAGYQISTPVTLLDTAPTLAHLLGIIRPREWEGRVVTEILV